MLNVLRLKNSEPVVSFVNLRRLVGILGMVLPLVCFFGGRLFAGLGLQPSISAYYYTNVRDLFVGLMVGVAMFLLTYRGYEKIDDLVSSATGIAALGVAVFPCIRDGFRIDPVGFFQLIPETSNMVHVASAGLFFFLLAMNSIFIFTLSDPSRPKTPGKKKRNAVYITCGVIILLALVVLASLNAFFTEEQLEQMKIVFFLETVLLEAFGISWLVKGETLLKDERSPA